MSFRRVSRALVLAVMLICGWTSVNIPEALAQQGLNRRTKSKVVPNYPELAQRMKITGVVRVMVTVSQNGAVKDAKLMGGHPVLATAALDAVKQWRFEPGPEESGMVEFRFDPPR